MFKQKTTRAFVYLNKTELVWLLILELIVQLIARRLYTFCKEPVNAPEEEWIVEMNEKL
jgi:hypothetical protein